MVLPPSHAVNQLLSDQPLVVKEQKKFCDIMLGLLFQPWEPKAAVKALA